MELGAVVTDDERFGNLSAALEYYVPEVLAEVHSEWRRVSFDGVWPDVVKRTGLREIEIIGLCNFMSDQTLTPHSLAGADLNGSG